MIDPPTCSTPLGPIRHAVVLATTGRPGLLERALGSVAAQSRAPDRIILVADGCEVRSPALPAGLDVAVELLANRRTPGAAGAWNTALDHLTRTERSPASVVVSFLDDDDWWEDGHLACVADLAARGVEVIATPLVRHDVHNPDGRRHAPPDALRPEDFLVGNPGVQGSNLSVRLSALLEAGCFDEALRSCTDRDLSIRLADLGVAYARAEGGEVHHDTLHGGARLSDPGSLPKRAGLSTFFAKWAWRMTAGELAAAEQRAKDLFGWEAPAPVVLPPPSVARVPQTTGSLALVVGVIVDGDLPARALPLLSDLARLRRHPRVDRVDLVLLENGAPEGFDRVIEHGAALGLPLWPARREAQQRVGGDLGIGPAELSGRKSIAVARSLLHRFVFEAAALGGRPAAWILDDDARLTGDIDLLVDDIVRARLSGVDVLIGGVTGAPPIPADAGVRTQLVDLHAFLRGAATRGPSDPPPDAEPHNQALRDGRRDYYHDLARQETDRLETPFLPETSASDLVSAVAAVLGRCERILAGEQLFRPLRPPEGDPIAARRPSSFRGGNTVVFDLDLLRDVPNLSPQVEGRRLRRSDMIWAATARFARGREVMGAPVVVEHDRTHEPIRALDVDKFLDDLLGYAFFRALEELLEARRGSAGGPLGSDEQARVRSRARKFALERLGAFRLSFHRVRGLCQSFERLLQPGGWPSWFGDPGRDALARLVGHLRAAYTEEALHAVEQRVERQLADEGIGAFLGALGPTLSGAPAARSSTWEAWIAETRTARARALSARLGAVADEVLGMGAEGVVLRAGDRVLKVFDGWCAGDRAAHLGKLHDLCLHPSEPALPRVLAVHDETEAVMLETAYEPSEAYDGGHGPLVVSLLRSLRARGWAHHNLHPRNLRVMGRGLTIIDLGRSLEPATPEAEERMARRALLACRFASRKGLAALMSRSIDDGDFPEALGWEHLLDAVRGESPKRRLDAEIRRLVDTTAPRTFLDFGCGKPRDTAQLTRDREVVVFDPDPSLAPRWAEAAPGVAFLDERGLDALLERGERFEVVVCSLVLCSIGDGAMGEALRRLRRLVAPDGRVILAVCDPTSHGVRCTAYQERIGADAIPYEGTGAYEKRVRGVATTRVEHHRPLSAYRRAFARAGFAVAAEQTIDGVDVERFERISEFVVFELGPLPAVGARTTLLVKTCAQEAETLRVQIEHLVGQLGSPRAFDEVVVVVDPHRGPFPRQHHAGDPERLHRELDALVASGIVDRVLEGPRDGDQARRIAERWFGLASSDSRSENGQPALAILDGIDRASGDIVFHADADLLVARPDLRFDPIADALAVFDADAASVALSLPVCSDTRAVSRAGDDRGPFRVDAVSGWIHRQRLLALRPLPNELAGGRLALPWHRALDRAVAEGHARSLRRGSPGIWCASPDNARKHSTDGHLLLLDRVEAGFAPRRQAGRMAVMGSPEEWLGPKRAEPLAVVICGRNVPPGRVHRCLRSLLDQRGVAWGAVLVDDASDETAAEVLRRSAALLSPHCTHVRRRRRVGLLANTALAVREICNDPGSVIVLLDLDDALGTRDALARVLAAHAAGADVTVGSMVRTDKEASYPIDFTDPRTRRGGNVWQHLRTFRKALFDRLEIADLKLDGVWIDPANDWAMMVPIVEMAAHPVAVDRPLYLHEPSGPRTADTRAEREGVIARVLARPSYRAGGRVAHRRLRELMVLCYHRVVADVRGIPALYRHRGMVVSRSSFEAQMRAVAARFEPVSLAAVGAAARDERSLPERPLLVTFDDGYRDLVDVVLPVLERTGIPAVVFARALRHGSLPSWAPLDLLYHVLAASPDGDADFTAEAREALVSAPHAQQMERVLDLALRCGTDAGARSREALYLDAVGLREVRAAGIAVGSHGVEHVRWTTLPDDRLEREAAESASWLRSLGQGLPLALAYPDAAFDVRVARAAERAGFVLAFGLEARTPEVAPRLAIRRRIAQDDPMWIERIASFDVEAP